MPAWKILHIADLHEDVEVVRFDGSAVEVVEFAAKLSPPGERWRTIIASADAAEPLDAEVEASPDWQTRMIYERSTGDGWRMEETATDHGIWSRTPRNCIEYAIQRQPRFIVAFLVINLAGQLTQVVIYDGRRHRGERFYPTPA